MNRKNAGRLVGAIVLVQLALGILTNFVLTAPLFQSPGFVENASLYSQQIGLSALLGFFNGGLTVVIAIIVFAGFKKHSYALALCFLTFSGVSLAVTALENISVMSMVSFSEAYAAAAPAEKNLLSSIRTVVSSLRNWSHYTSLLFAGFSLFLFYSGLLRTRWIPKVLAAFGMIAALMHLTTIAMPFLGGEVIQLMMAPIGLSQIVTAGWLLIKGFPEETT